MGVKNWFSGLLGKQPPDPQAPAVGGPAQAQAAPWQQPQPPQGWPPPGPLPNHAPPPFPGAPGQPPQGFPGQPPPPQYAQHGFAPQLGGPGLQPAFPPAQPQMHGQLLLQGDPASLGDDFDRAAEVVEREAQLPAAHWRDDFGPLRADQGEEFFVHMKEIEQRAHDAVAQRQRARELGYRDFVHWHRTRMTFLKYTGEGEPNGALSQWSFTGPRCTQLMMAASARIEQAEPRGPNHDLLSPIEGVTIDQYAAIAASAARAASPHELHQLLSSHGMDADRYERVSKAWIARMSTDATATLATIYGNAFHAAGAAPPAGTNRPGAAASSDQPSAGEASQREPLPFEKYCELTGARAAWSKQGKDPDALMQAKFKMNAADLALVSGYWIQKAKSDEALSERQRKLSEVYEELYDDADPDPDADLAFSPAPSGGQHETLERWAAFLSAVMVRLRDALAEAEASCREMVTAHAADPLPLGNALGALGARKQNLDKRIRDAWSEHVSRALAEGEREAARQAAFEMEQALGWIQDVWEHFRVRWSAEAARAMWPQVQASMQKQVSCRQCARPIQPSVRYQAESVRCDGCGSVNQIDPESIVYTYFAMAPHALAEEQALEQRLAVTRHRREADAARKAEASRTGVAPDESVESLQRWQALEREYWVAYAAAKARVQPATVDEQDRLVESRMKQFAEHIESGRLRRTPGASSR